MHTRRRHPPITVPLSPSHHSAAVRQVHMVLICISVREVRMVLIFYYLNE
jgi:hypothetical protein